jgi:hypothetical protein
MRAQLAAEGQEIRRERGIDGSSSASGSKPKKMDQDNDDPLPLESYSGATGSQKHVDGVEHWAGATSSTTGVSEPVDTAVHALARLLAGVEVMGVREIEPEWPMQFPLPGEELLPADDEMENWQALAAEAKAKGTAEFKAKNWLAAIEHYGNALAATPSSRVEETRALFSNRSAALLHASRPMAALRDADLATNAAPQWPKAHFRRGCSLRDLGRLREAYDAFLAGQVLEPRNPDWAKEMDKVDALRRSRPAVQVRQMLFMLLPEVLSAWVRCSNSPPGALVLKVDAELAEFGVPQWTRAREGMPSLKTAIRVCFSERSEYLANLVANLQTPAKGVATKTLDGSPLKLAEVASFLPWDSKSVALHLDVRNGGEDNMVALVCRIPLPPCSDNFVTKHKDPNPPAAAGIQNVLKMQAQSGFPKKLPRFLGFLSYPAALNFPVIDIERDAPELAEQQKEA